MDKYAFSRVYEWFMYGLSHHAERRLKKWEVQINSTRIMNDVNPKE